MTSHPVVTCLILLAAAYGCAHVTTYSVAINGHVLKMSSAVNRQRRYVLDQLTDVEEDAVHSVHLSFAYGRRVEILKAVEGARELRHMLQTRLEQSRHARTTGS